tara:strand:+ start:20298 stop:21224 length:927 start_codon:yes stop_codon:yes gene_type:complete
MSLLKLGIIGLSKGNGHPFSFSSIINGYSDKHLSESGWKIIYEYIKAQKNSSIGFKNAKITHAWTQDEKTTEKLCRACLIPEKAKNIHDLIGNVDAVIIARDDYASHYPMAKLFLDEKIPIFVDKPLTIKLSELKKFSKYLKNGKLMSCSSLRYAAELDFLKEDISNYGELKLIRGAVINNWEQYGIHILEGLLSSINLKPISIIPNETPHSSFIIKLESEVMFQIDCLGDVPKTFSIEVWGTKKRSRHEIIDNFTMFKRMLKSFTNSIIIDKPSIPAEETINLIKLLIAGKIASEEKREVYLKELVI